jgi:hypothetical protein
MGWQQRVQAAAQAHYLLCTSPNGDFVLVQEIALEQGQESK